ncbi:hypothetical protein NMG60_11001191 [Bertholletia excelsa]
MGQPIAARTMTRICKGAADGRMRTMLSSATCSVSILLLLSVGSASSDFFTAVGDDFYNLSKTPVAALPCWRCPSLQLLLIWRLLNP